MFTNQNMQYGQEKKSYLSNFWGWAGDGNHRLLELSIEGDVVSVGAMLNGQLQSLDTEGGTMIGHELEAQQSTKVAVACWDCSVQKSL